MKLKPIMFVASSLAILLGVWLFVQAVVGVREPGGVSQVHSIEYKKVEAGKAAPDFSVEDIEGKSFILSQSKKIKVINFWASWCGPCIQEMPSMAALARKKVQEIEFVAVSCDDNEKDYRKALGLVADFKTSGIRIVFDPSKKLMAAYGVRALPESFIVDANGVLLKKIAGTLDWLTLPEDFFTK